MYHNFTYDGALASSLKAQWQIDDVLRADQELDFSRSFLPESLARTASLPGLSPDEQRTLNQISAHQYLWMFAAVEEFVLPFVLDRAGTILDETDVRVRALRNFAQEEEKHIRLFRRFHDAFERGFPVKCETVAVRPICAKVLSHHPLAVGLTVLMCEWMTQTHYVGSVRDAHDIDPLFKALLRCHWMEEAQHAKLDTLVVDALASKCGEQEFIRVFKEWLNIAEFIDRGLSMQANFNADALERAIGRRLPNRAAIVQQQYRAARWAYVGTGMAHPRFLATVRAISPKAASAVVAMLRRNWPAQMAQIGRRSLQAG